MLEARFVRSIDEVPRGDWDRLVGEDGSPFSEHAFLSAMEVDSAVPAEATQPCHLTLTLDGRLVAAMPLYVKLDGRGEFIYDYHWLHAAHQLGLAYYPKALAMAPFTPVEGPRLLVDPGVDKARLLPVVAEVLEGWARESGLHGVHLLFLEPGEADPLEEAGWLRRLTYQPRWVNAGYRDLDEFLARFRSKDRVKIRRQRRRLEEHGLEVEALTGDAIEEADGEAMHAFFRRTCRLYGTGSDYVKPGTWRRLMRTWRERLVLFMARRGRERVGCSLCVHKGGRLYGRYWGAAEELDSLYFNLAFYEPIELAIRRGWSEFYTGFGNARAKYDRGLEPYPTHSVHRLFDPRLAALIERHLRDDREETRARIERERARCKLKPG